MLHPQVAATVVDGQAVVVMADSGQVTVLNEVGTRIWELIDEGHNLGEIIQAIMAEYEVTPETAQQDTEYFINRLVEIQAIVLRQPTAVE